MKFKKIFISGGAGYVGSALVPSLLDKGYEVIVYDLYIYQYKFEPHQKLTQIKGDIRDRKKIINATKGSDAFIHLACISNDPSFDLDPDLGKSINYDAFKNIIDAVKVNKIKRLIVASSTSQYGIKPIDLDVTEEVEAEPITDYARFKIMCEKKLLKTKTGDLEYVFVRPATIAGYAPRLRLDLSVNILTTHAILNKKIKVFGGKQMRPAVDVRDIVRFYNLMLEASKDKIHREAFNVAYQNITLMDLAKLVKNTIGDPTVEIEVVPTNDPRSYHVNTDKMKRILDFNCKFSLQDSVKSVVAAFKKGLIKDGLNNPLYYNVKRMKEIKLK